MLDFRGAQLDQVLLYLAEAGGFTIFIDSPVRGTIDVFSAKPLTKKEALEVLNSALNKNGYAAIETGKMLTIMTKEKAAKSLTKVITGTDPNDIPSSAEIVTQIMPVAHISAGQLIRELGPILPTMQAMVSNEAGNAIIITDTRANIRHLAEIVTALDTALASISGIRVIPLQFADSKSVVTLLKELFATDNSRAGGSGGGGGNATSRFGGGGPGGAGGPGGFGGLGGFGGPGGGNNGGGNRNGGNGGSGGSGSAAAVKVVAVSDERSNSVVVTAPDDVMPTVEEVIKAVDINVEDPTELKVFQLKNSDPTEMATLLAGLFPDDTKSGSSGANSRFGSQGGGPGGFGGGPGGGGQGGFGGGNSGQGGGNSAAGGSERAKKQSRVLAVPDQRTSSLVVTTSRALMGQITDMIVRLDADSSRKQHVYIYNLENTDAQSVQQVLQDLFQSSQGTTRTSRGSTQNDALASRATQSSTGTTGGSGFGGGQGGGQGGGGGQSFGGGGGR